MSLEAIDAAYEAQRGALVAHFLDGGRLAVVRAPPGSGKTHTLIEVLATLAEEWRIAVAAQTNSQADDICRRFAVEHPNVPVTRFASGALRTPDDFPSSVGWVKSSAELPHRAGVTVGTTAKWSLSNIPAPFDLLAIDEAWQMGWADLMQCATISERFLMIGDPGQIPPVVTIDTRRWETSPRAPHLAAPEVVLAESSLEDVCLTGSLPACRRLPNEAVALVRPFYDFDFAAYVAAGARGLELPDGHPWSRALGSGNPLALTLATPAHGPPIEVDLELAAEASRVLEELLESGAQIRDEEGTRPLVAADVGITSTHRVMNAALSAALGPLAAQVRVDTPERWQGLERPLLIAVHPLSGVTDPSAFDLETGRLCVMASRHQVALIVLARDHVGETLRNYVPSAGQGPGRRDLVGRGHDAHLRFWSQLEAAGSLVEI